MHDYEVYLLMARAFWVIFVFAYGACVGSLINVLVYRLPRGLGVVTPPSRCPACGTRLTWRENIPVLGWLILRGRCRFCKSPISPEYPIVEAFVGLLFTLFFVLWYMLPAKAVFLGVDWGAIRPEWAFIDVRDNWPRVSWPLFIVLLTLLGSLTAMTIVDAKTYTIPLVLPWFATVVGASIHVLYAIWVQWRFPGGRLPYRSPGFGWVWAITTPEGLGGWWWVGASIGAVIGLGVSMILLKAGMIRRSFADYDEWEARVNAQAAAPTQGLAGTPSQPTSPVPQAPTESSGLTPNTGGPAPYVAQPSTSPSNEPSSGPHMWIQYPHARREMFKEIAFLSPCVALGFAGGRLLQFTTGPIPLWLDVLAGVLMGYLIGGGIVWGVRIFGSLGFGREAMGLGDVHLMAAVGVCSGWIDAALAFLGAAFVGLAWAVIGRLFSGKFSRALPYGPYLAVATVLVLLCKPWIEQGLTHLLQVPPGQPSINIP